MICQECKKEMSDNTAYCPYCGRAADKNSDYPKAAVVVLSFLLPIIGIIAGLLNIRKGRKDSGQTYLLAAVFTIAVAVMLIVASL